MKRGEIMEEALTRAEHNEFVKRIEAEEHRQNRRLAELEESTKQINLLVGGICIKNGI